jgi:hypothetical protein
VERSPNALFTWNSRDDRPNLPTVGSFQFRNAIDLDLHRPEAALGNPFTDQCFLFVSKSFD